MTDEIDARIRRIRDVRDRLSREGPIRSRPIERDFETVSLPRADCDVLRDAVRAEQAVVVIEVGLAYGSSALAIGEALASNAAPECRHVIVDPFQMTAFGGAGWQAMCEAGLDRTTLLLFEPSSVALPRLLGEGLVADAAFVDGSHRFHEVFLDLYYLRKLVRPGGLVVLDDATFPSVATALAYFDVNLRWERVDLDSRLEARRLPADREEPAFTAFQPFTST